MKLTHTKAVSNLRMMKPSQALARHRNAIREIVASERASNPRVFGSVLHGNDTEESDLDLLIDPDDDMTLFNLGGIIAKLHSLLGVPVDVATPRALPESWRAEVLASAVPV